MIHLLTLIALSISCLRPLSDNGNLSLNRPVNVTMGSSSFVTFYIMSASRNTPLFITLHALINIKIASIRKKIWLYQHITTDVERTSRSVIVLVRTGACMSSRAVQRQGPNFLDALSYQSFRVCKKNFLAYALGFALCEFSVL